MKRSILMLVLASLALMSVIAAPGSPSNSTVRVGIFADPAELSPFSALSPGRIALNRTLYEFLIDREGFGGKMVGVIMKDYKKIDAKTYNLTVYDYVYDTAGNHLTAKDVAFSYNTAKQLGNLPKLKDIESVKALDDNTVQFVFSGLKAGDLETLWSECPIVTQVAYEGSKDKMATTPVGTTAYKLKSFTPGSSIVLERVQKYWQTDSTKIPSVGRANIGQIEFQIIPESSQMAIALETGKIDISTSVAVNDLARFDNGGKLSKDFLVAKLQKNQSDYILFNCSDDSVFKSQLLRQAVCYAIDKKAVAQGSYKGEALICKTFGNAKYADYSKKWDSEDYYSYNPQKAKELLAKAGYKQGQLTVRIMTNAPEIQKKDGLIIQGYLIAAGINAKIVSYESALFNTYKYDPKQYDILVDQYASTDYLVNIWKLVFDSTQYKLGTLNFVKDDKLQQLLETARSIDGHTPENIDAFHQYLKTNAYGVALVEGYDNIVYRRLITKVVTDARGFVLPGACEYAAK